MQRTVTNSVKTVVFCLSTSTIKTRVHFFPSAGAAGGHSPVSCLLTLFGKGVEKKSVLLDGGRLNQPDGLRLEDAFPVLRGEVSGVFGLEIQLSCPQARINLLSSQAAVEFVSSTSSMMYGCAPFVPMTEETEEQALPPVTDRIQSPRGRSRAAVAVQDGALASSLVIVNAGQSPLKPELSHAAQAAHKPLHVGTLSPESVVEVPLDEAMFRESAAHDTIWGSLRVEKMLMPDPAQEEGASYYLLFRDPATKRPISACAL